MKPIEEYFKPFYENGTQVGVACDFSAIAEDRAIELYPKNKKMREAFRQGFIECQMLSTSIERQNQNFKEKSRIIRPHMRTV